MNAGPLGLGPQRRRRHEGWGEQLALECRVVQLGRHRPGDADHRGAAQILGHRVAADPNRRGDLVAAPAADVLETKNLSDLTHRQSLGWHGALRCRSGRACRRWTTARRPRRLSQLRGGRLAWEWVAGFRRNHRLLCTGIRIAAYAET